MNPTRMTDKEKKEILEYREYLYMLINGFNSILGDEYFVRHNTMMDDLAKKYGVEKKFFTYVKPNEYDPFYARQTVTKDSYV